MDKKEGFIVPRLIPSALETATVIDEEAQATSCFRQGVWKRRRDCFVVFVVQRVLEVQIFCILSDLLHLQAVPGGAICQVSIHGISGVSLRGI